MGTDAVVIGSGPNGLVAANVLADHGWRVLVLEAAGEPGGAVRTAEVTAPGFRNDLFSAFYPLAVKSPVMAALDLERWGLRWARSPLVLANPTPDGPSAIVSMDLDETAASLDAFAAGDGDAWRRLYSVWERAGDELIGAITSPIPPVRMTARLVAALGPAGIPSVLRVALSSVGRLARAFRGAGGPVLLGGNAGHADIPMGDTGSGLFGWMMCCLGQDVGFPAPVGGSAQLTMALVRRLESLGGEVRCGSRVEAIEVAGGRARAVRTSAGDAVAAPVVLADVSAPSLFLDLVGPEHLPPRYVRRVRRFVHGPGTVKVDWALSAPISWRDPACGRAGTVHLADSLAELTTTIDQVDRGVIPDRPFALLGQMTTVDQSRSPSGTEAVWAYAHVPQHATEDAGGELQGKWDDDEGERFADRIEERVERHAPGFRSRILARHVFTPPALEAENANLVGGDVGGGTAKLSQQLILRPVLGWGRAETPIAGLYLASASAHPGGGVHGACGANAARAALAHDRLRRRLGDRHRAA
jgi:phytoene dehydrogenase-like protein